MDARAPALVPPKPYLLPAILQISLKEPPSFSARVPARDSPSRASTRVVVSVLAGPHLKLNKPMFLGFAAQRILPIYWIIWRLSSTLVLTLQPIALRPFHTVLHLILSPPRHPPSSTISLLVRHEMSLCLRPLLNLQYLFLLLFFCRLTFLMTS